MQQFNNPIYHSTNRVRARHRLSKVLWQGRQWSVTTHGVERRDEQYYIKKTELERVYHTADPSKPKILDWPMHIATKPGVDLDDFLTAFLISLSVHGRKVPGAMVQRTIEKAQAQRRTYGRY